MDKLSKTRTILGYSVIITTFVAIVSTPIFVSEECYDIPKVIVDPIEKVYFISFGCQSFLCLVSFWNTFISIFKATSFEPRKCTQCLYIISFCLLPIYFIVILVLHSYASVFAFSLNASIFMMILIVFMISLVILFVSKLINVYKTNINGKNDSLVNGVTQTTILTTISVFLTLLHSRFIIIGMNAPESWIWPKWTVAFVILLDMYTNFLCVVLCLKSNRKYYVKWCKCCDKCCRKCWIKIINKLLNIKNEQDRPKVDLSLGSKFKEIDQESTTSTVTMTVATATVTEQTEQTEQSTPL